MEAENFSKIFDKFVPNYKTARPRRQYTS